MRVQNRRGSCLRQRGCLFCLHLSEPAEAPNDRAGPKETGEKNGPEIRKKTPGKINEKKC